MISVLKQLLRLSLLSTVVDATTASNTSKNSSTPGRELNGYGTNFYNGPNPVDEVLPAYTAAMSDDYLANETYASNETAMDNSTGTTAPADNQEVTSDALAITVTIYGVMMIMGWLYFELFRERNRLAYSTRDRSEDTRNPLCEKKWSFLGWIRPVQTLSDDEIVEYCGLDILMFLRFQRVGIKVALVGVVSAIFLLPIYATGGNLQPGKRDELEYLTMGNVPAGSPRLYASVVAAYWMTFTVLYFVWKEYKLFVERKHTYMTKANVQQYSVLIEHIPQDFRSEALLHRQLNILFPNQVSHISLAVKRSKLKELQKKIALQEKTRGKLEHALVYKSKTGIQPVHKINKKKLFFRGDPVDSIDCYEKELIDLNNQVEKEIQTIMVLQEDNPIAKSTDEMEHNLSLAEPQNKKLDGLTQIEDTQHTQEPDEENATPKELETTRASVLTSLTSLPTAQTKMLASKVSSLVFDDNSIASNAAFVTFNTIQAAQTAEQFLQSDAPHKMTVKPAPGVDDVLWNNIGLQHKVKEGKSMVATILSTLIIFFWTIPTTFVVALASVDGLSKTIPGFSDFVAKNPWVVTLLEQLGPLIFVAMGSAVPSIFRMLCDHEGHQSLAKSQASMFVKLVYFQLVQRFFVATVSGSIMNELQNIINEPASIINILGESIPGQSSFFMSTITIQIGLSFTLELVRLVPIVTALVHRIVAPQLTERERNSTFMGIRPLVQSDQFNYLQPAFLSQSIFIFVLIVVYAPVAPVLTFFGMAYFLIGDTVYRRAAVFVYDPATHTAGDFWHSTYHSTIIALVLGQLSLVGILGIKKSGAVIFLFFLPIFTLYFNRYICSVYPRIAKNVTLEQACRVDRSRDSGGSMFLDSSYLQPALQQQPLAPEYTTWKA